MQDTSKMQILKERLGLVKPKSDDTSDGVPTPVSDTSTANSDSCSGGACSDLHNHAHAHTNRLDVGPLPSYEVVAKALVRLNTEHQLLKRQAAELSMRGLVYVNSIQRWEAQFPRVVREVLQSYAVGSSLDIGLLTDAIVKAIKEIP